MVFSGITFLYYFLPIMLLVYFICPKKYRNIILLIGSLIFYFYGETKYFLLLVFSSIFNYLIGKKIESSKHKKIFLTLGLIVNFGLLFYFKYFDFFIENINALIGTQISLLNIVIPIGISFFTFKNASYLIDIYNGKIKASNSLINYSLYLCTFQTIVQGPIVRYKDVEKELSSRKESFSLFSKGVSRFILGLSKKVLIANVLGELTTSLAGMASKSIISYWLKASTDILRLYIDFSGYSDMAIGLGLMFGFKYLENFDYPFMSKTMTEFWRRWHISLSSWFKDYIYIPLGGSKVSPKRRIINILIVWLLTGLWHGSSWNFILWGLYFGIILIIEKKLFYKFLNEHKVIGRLITDILVMIGFIFFYQTTMPEITVFFKSMFGFEGLPLLTNETIYYIKNYLIVFTLGVIISTPLIKNIITKLKENKKANKIINVLEVIMYIALLIISTAFIIDESFSPFLYFRF